MRESINVYIKSAVNNNKEYFDVRHKPPRKYRFNDYVLITNVVTESGLNKKLLPKFKGPYVIKTVLPNDHYVITDPIEYQITPKPIFDTSRMRPFIKQHFVGTECCVFELLDILMSDFLQRSVCR